MTAARVSEGKDTLSIGRRLVYACLPLVFLVVASEVILRLYLPVRVAEQLHSSRGFDPEAHYLVPDPEHSGGWVTQLYNGSDREVVVPPRNEAIRVLLFGGSNVRGFPETRLEQLLDRAMGGEGVDWEVINLGRAGYGSRRVLYLFEQAMVLRPDVVVIYSGHNEFIERGFASELAELGGQPSVAVKWLSRLRSFELLAREFADPGGELPPTNLDRADPSQRELSWSQTIDIYADYSRNLELMCAIASDLQVPVLLSTVVTNMMWLPRVWTPSTPLSDELAQRHRDLVNESFRFIPKRYRDVLRPALRLRATAWIAGGNERTGDALPRLRELRGSLGPSQWHAGDESRQVELWCDPELWHPVVPRVLDWYAEVVFPSLSESEVFELRHAAALLQEALQIVPDDPQALFYLGLVTFVAGDRGVAVSILRKAAGFDRSPNNANDRSNDIVRSVAELHSGTRLLDADRVFRSRCPDDLVGYEVLMDACHLHPGARDALMMDMAKELLRMELR